MQRRDVILLKALSTLRQGLRPLSRFVLRVQPMTIESTPMKNLLVLESGWKIGYEVQNG